MEKLATPSPALSCVDTLLQLLLAVGLVLALLAGAAAWLWRCKFKRLYGWGMATSILPVPPRLQLKPSASGHSRKEERVAQRQSAFREMGFVDLGVLEALNVPGLRLFVQQHPETGLVAMVEERDCAGTWSDVLLADADGTDWVLASNAHRHFHFYFLPGDRKLHQPDAPERALVEAVLQAQRPPSPPLTLSLEQFIPALERAYARRIDSLLLEGFEDADIRRLLRDSMDAGTVSELSARDLANIKGSLGEMANNFLRTACASEFAQLNHLPAAEWHRSRDRLLVIHDRTPLPQLKRRCTLEAFLTDALRRRLSGGGPRGLAPREAFARLNALLPPAQRYKKLGEVSCPVPADVYRAPLAVAAN